jgi:hypothetical protein
MDRRPDMENVMCSYNGTLFGKKKEEIMTFATQLEDNTLSETHPSQRDKCCMLPYF